MSAATVQVTYTPDTYTERKEYIANRLFRTPVDEGLAYLHNYIERKGTLLGYLTRLWMHSYFHTKEEGDGEIAREHQEDPNRIEEALVQLRDIKRRERRLTLDDVIHVCYPLAADFDRTASFSLRMNSNILNHENCLLLFLILLLLPRESFFQKVKTVLLLMLCFMQLSDG